MGVDIFWRAFDDEEVERMWGEHPLGELISLVEGDKLFWQRDRGFLPEETRYRQEEGLQAEILGEHLKTIAVAANLNETVEWNIRNGLASHVTQDNVLHLDRGFMIYFTYADYGGSYALFSEVTAALYKAHRLDFDEDDLLQESTKPRWLSIMREADVKTIAKAFVQKFRRKHPRLFLRKAYMDEEREAAKWALESLQYVLQVFDIANKHGLHIYTEVDADSFEHFCGIGKYNVVARFQERFRGVTFPSGWIEHSLRE